MVSLLLYFSTHLSGCDKKETTNLNNKLPESNDEIAGVLISEILPDPKKDGVEFVEIYNNSMKVIDLQTLQLASTNSNGKRSKLHAISKSSVLIYPFTYKLLSTNSEIVQTHYPIQDTSAFHNMLSFPTLTNSQGSVILFSNEIPIDSLYYQVDMHDVFIKNPKGVSLERVGFNKPTNAAENFISAAATVGYATPGYQNSQLENKKPINQTFFLSSKTFAPSLNEQLKINFRFHEGGKMVNLLIFNSSGREVRSLLKNHRLGTKDLILWDGLNNENQKLPFGVYFLSIEIFDSKGNLNIYKDSCVLAGKI